MKNVAFKYFSTTKVKSDCTNLIQKQRVPKFIAPQKRRELLDWAGEQLQISKLEDWYNQYAKVNNFKQFFLTHVEFLQRTIQNIYKWITLHFRFRKLRQLFI